jgi:hypothetical protein
MTRSLFSHQARLPAQPWPSGLPRKVGKKGGCEALGAMRSGVGQAAGPQHCHLGGNRNNISSLGQIAHRWSYR